MRPIAKIDAHHHLWTKDSPNHPVMHMPGVERFYGHTDGLKIDFGPEEFIAAARRQNVVKSVYVETHYKPALQETADIQAIADRWGFPQGILSSADLTSDDLASDLEVHGASANFRGFRLGVNWSPIPSRSTAPRDGMMREANWRRGYALLGQHGLIADLLMWPQQLADGADLAEALPQTATVVEHTGMPIDRDADSMRLWREGMARLAALPHVTAKISGLGMVMHDWTTESIAPLVDEVIGLFGADRCMFASNFPVDGLHATYDQVWDAFDHITAQRPAAERAWLFHDTAQRVYRI